MTKSFRQIGYGLFQMTWERKRTILARSKFWPKVWLQWIITFDPEKVRPRINYQNNCNCLDYTVVLITQNDPLSLLQGFLSTQLYIGVPVVSDEHQISDEHQLYRNYLISKLRTYQEFLGIFKNKVILRHL